MRVAIIYQSMKPGNNPRRKKQEKHFEVSFDGTHKMQYKILIQNADIEKSNQVKTIWPYLRILCGCKGRSSGPTSTS